MSVGADRRARDPVVPHSSDRPRNPKTPIQRPSDDPTLTPGAAWSHRSRLSPEPVIQPQLVSILIVNWNTREAILRCLDALPASIDAQLKYEVIVVDNGSVDGSAEALQKRSDIALISNDENRGFAAAVNQAYARSSGEFVLLLNSDVDLTVGSLSALTQFLLDRPHVAGVGPLYLNPDGSPQPFHFRLPTFAALLANGSQLVRRIMPGSTRILRDYRMLDDDFSAPLRVPQPSASCLLLRRSCLLDGVVFDERYPIFFNDVMLARRLSDRGLELWVTPDSVVVHEAHSSARQLGKALRRQYLASIVRMLEETESSPKVWTYRAVIFSQNLVLGLAGRTQSLGAADLWRTLAGDPGPLPTRPSRLDSHEDGRTR
jgi:GT2 family glycosyltransferase